jgi:uncharacterized protein (TIGR02679 family)
MRAPDELRALLSQEGFRRPLALARERVEQYGDVKGSIYLSAVTPEELRCLTAVIGSRWRAPMAGQDVNGLALRRLDEALRASSFACTLPQALQLLAGNELANHHATRTGLRDARDAVWTRAARHPAVATPRTAVWLERARSNGGLARLAYSNDGDALIACLDAAVLLPADPAESRSVLAARLRGSAHALDTDQPAGQLLLSLLATWEEQPTPTAAAAKRELLEHYGVLADSISCSVTVLNLPTTGGGMIDAMTRVAAGRHLSLTLGNLTAEPLGFLATDVYVCENPSLLAEAERSLGKSCRPLVCADGQFNTACLRLLQALSAAGCRLFLRGDFDWGGLHIVSRAMQAVGGETWRYDVHHYQEAVQELRTTKLSSRRPRRISAPLQTLAEAIADHGRGVHEEALLRGLLSDLRVASQTPAQAREGREALPAETGIGCSEVS